MLDHELDECFRVVLEVSRNAGKIIKEAYSKEKRVETKCSIADLVTETDQMVEKIIISTLRKHFPSHSFIGEESVAAGDSCQLTDNPTWIIDPIDGTSNFVHRFPYTAVSIGFLVNQKAQIGIVYNPILDEMYSARLGQGAFCNDTRLQVTATKELGKALICTEFGSGRDVEKLNLKFKSMRSVLDRAHGLRMLGSCALHMCLVAAGCADAHFSQGISVWDIAAGYLVVQEAGGVIVDTGGSAACNMCMVAAGHVDAYFESGMHCWDIAAGELIVTEAGGVVLDLLGGPLDLMARRVLCAGTKELAAEIASHLDPVEYERD